MAAITYSIYSKPPIREEFEKIHTVEQGAATTFDVVHVLNLLVERLVTAEGSSAIIEVRDGLDNLVWRIGP